MTQEAAHGGWPGVPPNTPLGDLAQRTVVVSPRGNPTSKQILVLQISLWRDLSRVTYGWVGDRSLPPSTQVPAATTLKEFVRDVAGMPFGEARLAPGVRWAEVKPQSSTRRMLPIISALTFTTMAGIALGQVPFWLLIALPLLVMLIGVGMSYFAPRRRTAITAHGTHEPLKLETVHAALSARALPAPPTGPPRSPGPGATRRASASRR